MKRASNRPVHPGPKLGDASLESTIATLKLIMSAYSAEDQDEILRRVSEYVRPINVDRAGNVLSILARIIKRRPEWSTDALKSEVQASGINAEPKEIYNAVNYLIRRGHLHRVGYGRYVVDGVEVVTSEDLGSASSRNEDGYRID